ncbi:MAG: pyridoxamine 5'-phosphate oxidase family protein [Desulfobacterales bacterium]|nr:pyridoxamine 5'-phosphate oxidase family protein [Desulfobacterales bacterium]
MREDIKELIRKRRHCVLATALNNEPYCSLMAYTTNADCTHIFMVTYRSTRKFKNLTDNPRVSLLIDSRNSAEARALTVQGEVKEIRADAEKKKIREFLLNIHPHMQNFLDHPDAAYISIKIKSLIFLNGLTGAYYERID